MEQGTCRLGEGECSKAGPIAQGWCSKHYQRMRKTGTLDLNLPIGRPSLLVVAQGQRFGRGVVTETGIRVWRCSTNPGGSRGARLICDCGTSYEAALWNLLSAPDAKRSTSCGCERREAKETAQRKSGEKAARVPLRKRRREAVAHGLSRHALYPTWYGMLDRTGNPEHKNFALYGGRGIRVCGDWQDVRAFISWIESSLGPKPPGMSLDRIDNDGNYEPGNVRWATQTEQVANSRRWADQATHCGRGHEYTPANTHITKTGYRNCRKCARQGMAARRAARREQVAT
jgi:hypothetical protein